MSRIKVGKIEIDGHNVSISGRDIHTKTTPPPHPSSEITPLIEWASSHATWLIMLGLSISICGAVWWSQAETFDLFTFLLHGGALTTFGLGVVGLALASRHIKQTEQARAHATVIKDSTPQLVRHLHSLQGPATLEALSKGTKLPPERLVKTLAHLVKQDVIIEDLNTETGDWEYQIKPDQFPSGDIASIEQRLGAKK